MNVNSSPGKRTVAIPVPGVLTFTVPRDYANCCGNTTVRIEEGLPANGTTLGVSWNDRDLVFEHSGRRVIYDASKVVELIVDYREEVMGEATFCTLRVQFEDEVGGPGSVPLLTGNVRDQGEMQDVVAALQASALPIPIEVLPVDGEERSGGNVVEE